VEVHLHSLICLHGVHRDDLVFKIMTVYKLNSVESQEGPLRTVNWKDVELHVAACIKRSCVHFGISGHTNEVAVGKLN
jgi:hypothetical protein